MRGTFIPIVIAVIMLINETNAGSSCISGRKRFMFGGSSKGFGCMLMASTSMCSKMTFASKYSDLCASSCLNCDKYFHCMANSETANNCDNGKSDAETLSNCRDPSDSDADSKADRDANAFGRNGGDCAAKYLCRVKCSYDPETKTCLKSNCP